LIRATATITAVALVGVGSYVVVSDDGSDEPVPAHAGGVQVPVDRVESSTVSVDDGSATGGGAEWVSSRLTGDAEPVDVEKLTTPTRIVTRNPDGTLTAEISSGPVRVRRDGKWVDLDPTLVQGRDGTLGPKVGFVPIAVASRADGTRAKVSIARAGDSSDTGEAGLATGNKSTPSVSPPPEDPFRGDPTAFGKGWVFRRSGQPSSSAPLVSVDTHDGVFTLAHPDADAVAAEVVGEQIRYPGALSHGRDVTLQLAPRGFEESVILVDGSAPGFYEVLLEVPEHTIAQESPSGILFVDPEDDERVVAAYGSGVAYDSAMAGYPVGQVVDIAIVSQGAGVVRLRVSVDEAWLADPMRVFPVTIDPIFTDYSTTRYLVGDTYVQSSQPSSGFWTSYDLFTGLLNFYGYHWYRSQVFFIVDALRDGHAEVNSASFAMSINNWVTCEASPLEVRVNTGWNGPWTTWYNYPGVAAAPMSWNWVGCGYTFFSVGVTEQVRKWIGLPSFMDPVTGFDVRSGWEGWDGSFHKYASGDTWIPPSLTINYTRYDATYATTRPAESTTKWTRVEGQASQIPVKVTNTGTDAWPANSNYSLACHIKDKTTGAAIGDCPSTKLPEAVAPGQTLTMDAAVPALDANTYDVSWDLIKEGAGGFWFKDRNVSMLTEDLIVTSVNPYSRGDNPYVAFAGGVNTATGTYFYDTTDVATENVGPALAVSRSYNHRDSRSGWFGTGWSSSYEITATPDANGDVTVRYPDGRLELYARKADGTNYAPPGGFFSTLIKNANGTFSLIDKDQSRYDFASPEDNGRLIKITDANGRSVTLDYDTSDELGTVVAQPSGRTLTFSWSGAANHRHVSQVATDPAVRAGEPAAPLVWTYTYSGTENDQLASVCDPKSGTGPDPKCETFTYDTNSTPRITTVTRPLGNTAIDITYIPGSDDRVATTTDGAANTTTYAYDTTGSCGTATVKTKTTVTDPRGGVTVSQYDPGKHLVCFDDELNQRHLFEYDPVRGFLIKDVDATLAVTTFEYDNGATENQMRRGNVTTRVDANGHASYFSYDDKDHLLTIRDGRSADAADDTYLTTYDYDTDGNLLSTQPPSAPGAPLAATTWTYTSGSDTTGSYNGSDIPPKGLTLTEQRPEQNPTRYFYDVEGNLRRREDPTGLVTTFTFDALGLVTGETAAWTNPDETLGEATTTTTYDQLGQVLTMTEPAVTDPITNLVHQRRVSTTYDSNRNRTMVREHDIGGSAAPDPDRETSYEFDGADREFRTNYAPNATPTGGSMTREFDLASNVVAVTDQLGRRTETTYTQANRPDTITLKNADENAMPNLAQSLILGHTTYDPAGRVASQFDAEGRERRTAYDALGQVLSVTLFGPGGGQVVVLEEHAYDAVGNRTTDKAGDGDRVVTTTFYPSSLVKQTILDGVNRSTDWVYDGAGRPSSLKRSIGGTGTTEEIRSTYDPATGLLASETLENGATDLATTYGYDTRGLKTSVTDPRNNTTNLTYDLLGRQTSVMAPLVTINGGGEERPTATLGYTAYGEAAQAKEPNGNVTTTIYDVLGRRARIQHPAYTPPGGQALQPFETFTYDLAGNTTTSVDRRGETTSYSFDLLNRVTTKTDPQITGAPAPGVTTYTYDKVGNQTSVTDPTGRVASTTYDTRNRAQSTTVGGSTTSYGYDNLDNQTSVQPPGLSATTAIYNTASERISITRPGATPTTATYDLAGRPKVITDPLGRTTTNTYDLAGRRTRVVQAGGSDSATTDYGYDANGNQTTVTAPSGSTTTFTYDAANRLSGVSQPVATGQSITTSYAYDLAGNTTRLTDGNANTTTVAYNPWNLPTVRSEPDTPGQADAATRDYVTVYDAGGLPLEDRQPGGVTITRTFDELGRVIAESGSGPDTPSASRAFGYDLAGRRTNVDHPAGALNFTYDSRGHLTTTTGGAGTSTYSYDNAGRVTTRQDAAGTATFAWNDRNDLTTVTDPLTQTTRTNTWDDADQLTQVTYGATAPIPTRTLDYDGLGRLTNDTLAVDSIDQYSTDYTYDANSNVATRTIAPTGVAGAGTHQFGYDQADRLTSWTPPGQAAIAYSYDGAGNRTAAGPTTYTYDARNRLNATSAGDTFTWTPRGTLASTTTAQGTTTSTFDALGRLTQQGNTTYAYDGLDRIATRNTTPFTYTGTELDPTTDGTWTYARAPSGNLLALDDPTATETPAVLAGQNNHGDLTNLHTPAGAVTDTMAYDPFGAETTDLGTLEPTVGFQSDYTDPATGQTWMGARWYDPALDTFTARDTVAGQLNTPASLNRYTYAADNPLTYFDPDGHGICIFGISLFGGCDSGPSIVVTHPKPPKHPKPKPATPINVSPCGYGFAEVPCSGGGTGGGSGGGSGSGGGAGPPIPCIFQCYVNLMHSLYGPGWTAPSPFIQVAPQPAATAPHSVPVPQIAIGDIVRDAVRDACTADAYTSGRGLPAGFATGNVQGCVRSNTALLLAGSNLTAGEALKLARTDSITHQAQAGMAAIQQLLDEFSSGVQTGADIATGLITGPFKDCFGDDKSAGTRSLGCGTILFTALSGVAARLVSRIAAAPRAAGSATELVGSGRFVVNGAGDALDTARVTIPGGKFGYLLRNPSKSGVFADSLGFNQRSLDSALRSHLVENFGSATPSQAMVGGGTKFSVTGPIVGLTGEKWTITSVWGVDPDGVIRLITATP